MLALGVPLVDGSRFGRFRILACAGRGGMGEVYRAEDTTLNRVVALKTIREGTRSAASAALAAYSAARFEREARVLASFGHPNAVAIYLAPEDRFASMEDLVAALAAAPPLAPAAPVEPAPDTIRESSRRTTQEPRARGPWLVFLASGGAAVALGAAGLGVLVHRGALDVPTAPDDASGAPATIGDEPPAAAIRDEAAATDAHLGDEPPAIDATVATSSADEASADATPRGSRARDGAATDRVHASAVHVDDVMPALSDGPVRAWIGTRRSSLLACYRAHPAGRSCASTMERRITCKIAPNGTTTACETTNYAFNIREPLDCNFSDEGSRCVLRALDGTQGPLPFDASAIRFTVAPR